MGKGGRGGKAKQGTEASDDALLDAAIAENTKLKKVEIASEAQQKASGGGGKGGGGSSSISSSSGDEPLAGALSRDEIVKKLNAVPTFCILNGESNIVGLQDPERKGLEMCLWFTDAEEGKSALKAAKEMNPEATGLHLGVTPLGIAFALATGWAETTFYGDMRLCGSAEPFAGGQDVDAVLRQQLATQGLEESGWSVAVFCCDELQSPSVMPVFLSRKALVEAWITSGRKIADLPANLTVMVSARAHARGAGAHAHTGVPVVASRQRAYTRHACHACVRAACTGTCAPLATCLASQQSPPPRLARLPLTCARCAGCGRVTPRCDSHARTGLATAGAPDADGCFRVVDRALHHQSRRCQLGQCQQAKRHRSTHPGSTHPIGTPSGAFDDRRGRGRPATTAPVMPCAIPPLY